MTTCTYCNGARLVGWSGAGPILCPECSRGQDAFAVITQAWREQRTRVVELEGPATRAAIIDEWKAANGYDDLLKAYSDAVRALSDAVRAPNDALSEEHAAPPRCSPAQEACSTQQGT